MALEHNYNEATVLLQELNTQLHEAQRKLLLAHVAAHGPRGNLTPKQTPIQHAKNSLGFLHLKIRRVRIQKFNGKNSNQNRHEISPHTPWSCCCQTKIKSNNCWQEYREIKTSCIVGENVKRCSHNGN